MKGCKRCGLAISKGRLEILPDTNLCVKCSKEVGGEFDVIIVEENLGTSIISKPVVYKIEREVET